MHGSRVCKGHGQRSASDDNADFTLHKPSFPTRSKNLPRRGHERQLYDGALGPRFDPTRPEAVMRSSCKSGRLSRAALLGQPRWLSMMANVAALQELAAAMDFRKMQNG